MHEVVKYGTNQSIPNVFTCHPAHPAYLLQLLSIAFEFPASTLPAQLHDMRTLSSTTVVLRGTVTGAHALFDPCTVTGAHLSFDS